MPSGFVRDCISWKQRHIYKKAEVSWLFVRETSANSYKGMLFCNILVFIETIDWSECYAKIQLTFLNLLVELGGNDLVVDNRLRVENVKVLDFRIVYTQLDYRAGKIIEYRILFVYYIVNLLEVYDVILSVPIFLAFNSNGDKLNKFTLCVLLKEFFEFLVYESDTMWSPVV